MMQIHGNSPWRERHQTERPLVVADDGLHLLQLVLPTLLAQVIADGAGKGYFFRRDTSAAALW